MVPVREILVMVNEVVVPGIKVSLGTLIWMIWLYGVLANAGMNPVALSGKIPSLGKVAAGVHCALA